MISNSTFPQRFTEVDNLTRQDHYYLTGDDVRYFIGEYTARKGYAYSATNQLILNFKKPMDRHRLPEWRYKGHAIRQAADAFRSALGSDALDRLTLVPSPLSKAKGCISIFAKPLFLFTESGFLPSGGVQRLIVVCGSSRHADSARPDLCSEGEDVLTVFDAPVLPLHVLFDQCLVGGPCPTV